MGILKNIEWLDNSKNTLVYKVECKDNHINKGSVLTVREGQAVVFTDKGRLADVFLPGMYKLDTNNIPLLTKLMSWKYGFETPFKSDVYFVSTKQFTNEKWGTVQPITFRDADFGAIRVRAFGTYSFKVDDAYVFLKELFGTNSSFKTEDITGWLKSLVLTAISDAVGQAKVPFLDLAGNQLEFGKLVQKTLAEDFTDIGLKLVKFNFENVSLPENLQAALDKTTELGMLGKHVDTYSRIAAADAMKEAAKNPGMAGSTMGAGMGIGMGVGMGQMFGNAFGNTAQPVAAATAPQQKCVKCGASFSANAKFCPECGASSGSVCPKCKAVLKAGAKFCPECGTSLVTVCPKCKTTLAAGARFCPECGEKIS